MLKNLNIMYLTDIPFSKLSCQITLDKFYRFSDGFIDQKDGKEDKRFKTTCRQNGEQPGSQF